MSHLHNMVNRALAAFRAYEIFPHDTEFVRLIVLPMIAADVGSRLSQRIMSVHDTRLAYHFHEGVMHEYRNGLARREFNIVQNLNITGPQESNFKEMIMTWTTMFGPPGIVHSMKISLRQTHAESDVEFLKAQDRIAAATKFVRDYDKQQEAK